MKKRFKFSITTLLVLPLIATMAQATPIAAVDYDGLNLGAKITGPVGPDVEVSLIDSNGDSLGDLRSSVSCPTGFAACVPPNNAAGTIYTYAHTLIPGLDLPNDAPFPNPGTVLPFDDVSEFSLGFSATGFNGIAGYSFAEAMGAEVDFSIQLSASGELTWLASNTDWDTGEAITFFWQSTQAPAGPGGTYVLSNASSSASGAGPIPSPLEVDEPTSMLFLAAGLLFVRRQYKRKV